MSISRKIRIVFLFLLIALFSRKTIAAPELPFHDPELTISMDFDGARLNDILKLLSMQSGLNFIASESVKDRKVTLFLDKVAIRSAMEKLFKANNLTYELDEDSNIFIVKDWGKPQLETVTKVFYLKYASVESSFLEQEKKNAMEDESSSSSSSTKEEETGILIVLEKMLSTNGSVVEDRRTNSIIVTDVPSRMQQIEKVIAEIDVPQPQIMLEVEMLDVSKNTVDKLGFNWSGAGSFSLSVLSAARWTSFPFGGFKSSSSKSGLIQQGDGSDSTADKGIVEFSNLAMTLDFLRVLTDTKSLARPKILTLNNETAEIKITTNEAIGLSTSTTGSSTETTTTTKEAEREETGVSLKVTPQINTDTGEITMFLVPTVSEAKLGATFDNVQYKDPEVRSTKSTVRIKDGETIILGGLIRTELSVSETKLPIFGDMPIIGALFRHKNADVNRERELLVFITPHIVKDSNFMLAKAKKTVLPDREQSASTGFDRSSSIDSSLNRFEQKDR
ncbi:MAG: secretin N-terminal domain-containing protein [Candidatus Omnitrophota bacterium]